MILTIIIISILILSIALIGLSINLFLKKNGSFSGGSCRSNPKLIEKGIVSCECGDQPGHCQNNNS